MIVTDSQGFKPIKPHRVPVEEVAALILAWPQPRGYAAAIAERWGISVSTARQWANNARRRGLVPRGYRPPSAYQKTETPEYKAWVGMRQRCFNPNSVGYARYGGRGITVCDRWNKSFDDFLADVGPKPTADMSLDRIDPDGNYEPGNVRWADAVTQARNTSRFIHSHQIPVDQR